MSGLERSDEVILLGTKGGPAIRPGSAMPTSTLVSFAGRHFVVDCGLGVTRGLVDAGIELKSLELVFVTHLHSDHYLELGPLLHTAWTAGLKNRVFVFGPLGLERYWRLFLESMVADIELRITDEGRPDLRKLVQFEVLEEGEGHLDGRLSFRVMKNRHPPLTESFALSFSDGLKKLVFSGDTAFMPEMGAFALNADVLVHEAMLDRALPALVQRVGNGDERLMTHLKRSHTVAEDVARVAQTANVHKLVLHHKVPSDDPDFTDLDWINEIRRIWQGELYIGSDGMKVEF